jgi:hypothetical protein
MARALLALVLAAACQARDGPDFFSRPVPPMGPITALAIGGEPFARKVLAASLQGVVNRARVRLYLVDGQPGDNRPWETEGEVASQRFWLERYAARHGVRLAGEVDLDAALARFASEAAGFVVWAEDEPWTVNAATTLAGLHGLLVAAPADAPRLEALGLRREDDLRGHWPSADACIRDTFTTLHPRASPLALGVLSPDEYRLRDFLIQNRLYVAFARPGGPGWEALTDVLARTPPNQPVFGYLSLTGAEEFAAVRALSSAGKFLVPSDTTPNLSVHAALRVPLPAPPPPSPAPCAKGTLRVAIAVSDGDNLAIPLGRYLSPRYWHSPDRGGVPLGWSLGPGLADLAPAVAAYYAESRTDADELVAMLGIGYAHPSALPDPERFLDASAAAMARLGMTTLWQLDAVLELERTGRAWDALARAYAERRLGGLLLGYGAVFAEGGTGVPAPGRTGGLPVLLSAGRYEDAPADLERRVQAARAAWRAGGPDVVFFGASVWTNDLAGLAPVLRRLQAEPDLTILTPAQALACVAGE